MGADTQRVGLAVSPAGAWPTLLKPSFLDCFFITLLMWLFAAGPSGWTGLLVDGDAGWHIRTGEYILNTGSVPRVDLFSFSKPNDAWYAWEWLTDVLFASLHGALGLKGVVLLVGVVIPLSSTILFYHMLWRGANLFVAVVAVMLSVGASSVHYLGRPHTFTLLFLALSMLLLDRDRSKKSWVVWLLIPLTVLWTNMHGGFVAIIACCGLLFVGSVMALRWDDARRYGVLLAGVTLATLVNPYGIQLHIHIVEYLRADWIKNLVEEFQSPSFRSESMFQFEVLLFVGLAVAALNVQRRRYTEALWIAAWAHLALSSVRHMPLYTIVAGPWIAVEVTLWWDRLCEGRAKSSVLGILDSLSRDMRVNFLRVTPWMAVPVLVLLFMNEPVKWPKDFPKEKFPVATFEKYSELIPRARIFTSDQWADYLTYRAYPRQKIFLDGRSDYFGQKIAQEYVELIGGHWQWEKHFEKYQFDAALVPPVWSLTTLLKQHKDWRLISDDGQALLFVRRGSKLASEWEAGVGRPRTEDEKKLVPALGTLLNKSPDPAERIRGGGRG